MNIFVLTLFFLTSDTASVFNFTHVLKDGVRADTASGLVYRSDTSFIIRVTSPLEQIIFFSGDTMIVSYPKEKKAFKIKSGLTFKMQTPGGPVERPGTALKKNGFIFLKREKKGNIQEEVWTHPKLRTRVIYQFESGMLTGLLTMSEKNDTLLILKYDNFVDFSGKKIPLKMTLKTSDIEETYFLSNPRRVVLSDSIKNYLKIGNDFKVELRGFDNR